jgi:hypothetical protein
MYKHDFPAEITQSAKIYGENCWLFGCSTVGKVRTFNKRFYGVVYYFILYK